MVGADGATFRDEHHMAGKRTEAENSGMKTMTVETLFGPEIIKVPRKSIKLRQIRAVYEILEIREDIAQYLPADKHYRLNKV